MRIRRLSAALMTVSILGCGTTISLVRLTSVSSSGVSAGLAFVLTLMMVLRRWTHVEPMASFPEHARDDR